jgi:hypothetical protein
MVIARIQLLLTNMKVCSKIAFVKCRGRTSVASQGSPVSSIHRSRDPSKLPCDEPTLPAQQRICSSASPIPSEASTIPFEQWIYEEREAKFRDGLKTSNEIQAEEAGSELMKLGSKGE